MAQALGFTAQEDRRESPRLQTRFHVRGLGGDRSWSDRLGDVALGGVGFEYPEPPEATRFMVRFACPGDDEVRGAVADVVGYEDGFVRLRFSRISFDDQLAVAKSLDRLEDVSLDEAWRMLGWS